MTQKFGGQHMRVSRTLALRYKGRGARLFSAILLALFFLQPTATSSMEKGNGSALDARLSNQSPRNSQGKLPPIHVSPTEETDPLDNTATQSPPQAGRGLLRSVSLTSLQDALASKEPSPPPPASNKPPEKKRLSLLLPEPLARPLPAERRRTERRGSKGGKDARSPSPSQRARFHNVIPEISVRELSEPKSKTDICPVDVVVVHMCGNCKRHVDWGMSVFVESKIKDKGNTAEHQARLKDSSKLLDVQDRISAPSISWLDDPEMLPKAIPTARITGFGLDINQSISNNVNAPIDLKHAATEIFKELEQRWDRKRQPSIVFIGHGYGNIVIDQILFGELSQTGEERSRHRLLESTAAVAMFAPPLDSFENLINWVAADFDISKTSTKLFEARQGINHLTPDTIWNDFFSNTEKRNIATFGYLEQKKESKKPKAAGEKSLNHSKRFDRSWTSDFAVDDLARISSAKDIRFSNLTKAMTESVAVHQLLRAGRLLNEVTIDELLKASFDFNFQNRKGQTVLHLATERGLVRLVQCLVNSGKVDLDRQDKAGNTALNVAVESRSAASPDIVHALLKAGANTGITNKLGKSAEDMALEEEVNQDIKNLFRNPPLVEGPSGPRRLVRGEPANVNAQDACHRTSMVVREIFGPTESQPERHLPVYKSVHEFIYANESIDQFFQAAYTENSSTAICRWYHIPMNNMAWVHDLFAKLDLSFWPWPKPHKRSKIHHGRFMSPEATRLPSLQRSSIKTNNEDGRNDSWVIFMPYVSYESSVRQEQIANIARRVGTLTPKMFALPNLPLSRPRLKGQRRSTNDIAMYMPLGRDPEALAIKGYLNDHNHNQNQHLTLHVRRTLDQSYYNMLKDTSYRDRTQVVSRWAKSEWQDPPDHNILMVDQLWLWFIKGEGGKPDTIITSFPSREGSAFPRSTREADDLQRTVLGPTNRRLILESADLVSRILSVCCNAFDRHQHLESINFLQFFESAIGRAEEEETRIFRRFRRRAKMLNSLHEMHRGYSQHRSMLLKKLLDILKESKQLKEIKDILDEVKMIRSVLKDQLKVVESLQRIVTPSPHGITPQLEQEQKFSDVIMLIRETDESFDVMEAHAKEVEKGLEHLLDLKQKQANLWEARSSREGAEEAAKQGRTILVFTVVTIIFLPLSFMASFFSLGISIFPKTDGENNFPLGWVAALLFGISFAVSIPFILLAFNIEKFSDAWIRLKHSTNKHTAFIFLKPLRESRRLPSKSIQATGHKWYREWVSFITKHDLPLKPNEEMEARLKREMDGQHTENEHPPELVFHTDSSSEGEVTDDEEEMELIMQQDGRQSNLLRRMKG